jgi:hypothetical protein
MTRILLLFICVLLTFSTNLFSQEEVDVFKRIFTYTDSLSKAPQKGVVKYNEYITHLDTLISDLTANNQAKNLPGLTS